MGSLISTSVKKFVFPMSVVVAASLGGVLVIGSQSATPAPAAVQPRALSSAEVASFKPFAAEPSYKPFDKPIVAPTAAQPVVYELNETPVAAPVSALPVYGNIVNDHIEVIEQPRTAAVSTVSPIITATSVAGPKSMPCDCTINIPNATINVGTATINVLSSFKLNCNGKPVSSGGTTTP